jgi:hypothetical protein
MRFRPKINTAAEQAYAPDIMLWVIFLLCIAIWFSNDVVNGADLPDTRMQQSPTTGASDRSLAPAQYVSSGAPAPDRSWLAADYVQAARTLETISREQDVDLPRWRSERSGTYFQRMISEENLAPINNRTLPIETRMGLMVDFMSGLKPLTLLYLKPFQQGRKYGDELVEVMGFELRFYAQSLDVIDEFIATLDSKNPKYAVRLSAVQGLRQALAQIVDGSLHSLTERNLYRTEALLRLAQYEGETLPRIAPELPQLARTELPVRIKRLADAEPEPRLKAALLALSDKLERIGPSHFDAMAAPAIRPPTTGAAWKNAASKTGSFTIDLPGAPIESSMSAPTKSGKTAHAEMMILKMEDGTMFSILRMDGDTERPLAELLDELADKFVRTADSAEKKTITIATHSGREVTGRTIQSFLSVRIFAVDKYLYQLIVEGPVANESGLALDAQRFFKSFKLTSKGNEQKK